MNFLAKETQQRLSSAQTVPTPESIVKELIENSLDANATSISIALKSGGLDGITITDNGTGINDLDMVCLRYTTTKITIFDDISTAGSYGFRGEALNSGLIISTKREEDALGTACEYDMDGNAISKSVKSMNSGTVFAKKTAEISRKIKELVLSYSLINFNVRFSLKVGNEAAFVKTPSTTFAQSICSIFGSGVFKKLQQVSVGKDSYSVECFIAQAAFSNPAINLESDSALWKSSSTLPKIFINQKPAFIDKFLGKFISECRAAMHPETSHYPLLVLAFSLPADEIDVNLEPDKSKIVFSNAELVRELLGQVIVKAFPKDHTAVHDEPTMLHLSDTDTLDFQKTDSLLNKTKSVSPITRNSDICKNNTPKYSEPDIRNGLGDSPNGKSFSMISQSDNQVKRPTSAATETSGAVPDFQKIDTSVEVDIDNWSRGQASAVKFNGKPMQLFETPVIINQQEIGLKEQPRISVNPFQSKFNKNIERNRPAEPFMKKSAPPVEARTPKINRERFGDHSVPSQALDKSQPKIVDMFKRKSHEYFSTYRNLVNDHPLNVDPHNLLNRNDNFGKLIGNVDFKGKNTLKSVVIDNEVYLVNMQRVAEKYTGSTDDIIEGLTTTETCPHGKSLLMKIY
ncbi:ATP-binding mismatch repair protein [Terramyces sp. JEL0728]|nr:ATP-binding mismatch repair protein [Terramyces sp. JEL0728]